MDTFPQYWIFFIVHPFPLNLVERPLKDYCKLVKYVCETNEVKVNFFYFNLQKKNVNPFKEK